MNLGRKRVRAMLTLFAWAAHAGSAHATSGSLSGIGPRTQALAGAGAALDVGYEAAFQNPAGLAYRKNPTLHVGYAVTSLQLYWQRQGEAETRVPLEQVHQSQLGFTLPLELGEQRLVFGLASISPDGFVARAELPPGEEPQFPLLVAPRRAVDLDLSLGFQPLDWLALGVGLRALASLSGTASVTRTAQGSTTVVDDVLTPVLAPLAGVSLFFGSADTAALVLRAPLRADFDVQLAAVDLGATQLPPLELAGVAHYDPLSLTAEYAHRFGSLRALAGAVYQRFQDTPARLPPTLSCPPERPDCLALPGSSPELHDTVELHAAATYELGLTRTAKVELRAGYAYVPSPLPEQRGPENLLDNARHRLGLGYGLELKAPLSLGLDFACQLEQLVRRTHHKLADVPGDNPGAPALSSGGSAFSASLGLSLELE